MFLICCLTIEALSQSLLSLLVPTAIVPAEPKRAMILACDGMREMSVARHEAAMDKYNNGRTCKIAKNNLARRLAKKQNAQVLADLAGNPAWDGIILDNLTGQYEGNVVQGFKFSKIASLAQFLHSPPGGLASIISLKSDSGTAKRGAEALAEKLISVLIYRLNFHVHEGTYEGTYNGIGGPVYTDTSTWIVTHDNYVIGNDKAIASITGNNQKTNPKPKKHRTDSRPLDGDDLCRCQGTAEGCTDCKISAGKAAFAEELGLKCTRMRSKNGVANGDRKRRCMNCAGER